MPNKIVHRKSNICSIFLWFIFVLIPTLGQAQTTGKIAGTITDEQGESLPGVNVRIVDSNQGNATNVDGEYFILNIKPGTYTILVSYIGFKTIRMSDVQVSVDRTTRLDFVLEEELLEGEEIVVVAQKKLIVTDQTSASAKVSGEELLNLPVQSFVETVSVQAGVNEGQSGGLHIRGGRSSEIKYYVDGIAVSNPYSNALAVPVENTAVQEVEVISGTYNAEFGQANSGIINIVTRDGSNNLEGTFISRVGTYRTGDSDVFFGLNESPWLGEQSYEASLSGPILRDKLFFFSSAKVTTSEGWLKGRRVFLPSDSSDFSSNNAQNWIIEASGDSAIVPMNTRSGYTLMNKLSWKTSQNIKLSYSLTRSRSESSYYQHLYRYNPDFLPTQFSGSWNHLIALNHVLSPRSFYNIRLSAYTTRFQQYVYDDPFDQRYTIIEGRSGQPSNVFNTGGVNNYHLDRQSTTYAFRFDITRQFGTTHMVKAGVEYRYNNMDFEEFFIQARRVDGFERRIPPLSSRLHNAYVRNPVELAAFIQDKIEIQDLIVNIGLRFDYFDAQATIPTDLRDPANTANLPISEAYKATDVKWQLSPRIGFAFPISENGVIHASYGQFFQIPEYSRLYENPEFEVQSSTFTQYLGNPNLDPQSSTTYEIGLQQQIGEFIGIDLTAYYRDIRALVGTRLYEARTGGDSWGRYENTDFGRVRGITLATEIRTTIGLLGSFSYTYQLARGNASDPKQAFYDAQQNNESTRNLVALDWDQTHNVSGTLSYVKDKLSLGLISVFYTGYPFTPQDIQRNRIDLLRNQARYNAEFIVDLRAAYVFDLSGWEGQLFLTGENLLNFYRQDREPKIFASEIDAHAANGNTLINSLREFKTNPLVQKPPRSIHLGVQIRL